MRSRFDVMKKIRVLFFAALTVFPAAVVHAQDDDLVQPGILFTMPAGARAPGMGGAFSAIADDASSPLWNPAGVSQLKKSTFTLMQSKSIADLKYNFMNVAYPLSAKSTLSVSYLELSIGGLENWQVTDYDCDKPPAGPGAECSGPDLDPAVTDTGTNNADIFDDRVEMLGFFDNKESAIILTYAQQLQENLSLGTSIKFFTHKIGPFQDPVSLSVRNPAFTNYSAKATGTGVDFGVLYKLPRPPKGIDALSVGLVFQHLVPLRITWNTGSKETAKLNLRAGLAVKLLQEKLTLALDYDKRTEKGLRMGAEYWVNPMIGIRLGNDDGDFTAGASLRISAESVKNFQVDYAYARDKDEIANSNLIAITVGF